MLRENNNSNNERWIEKQKINICTFYNFVVDEGKENEFFVERLSRKISLKIASNVGGSFLFPVYFRLFKQLFLE